jgi:hypothetical protein
MEMAGIPIYGGYFTFDMAGMPIYGGYFTFDMVQCALLIAPYVGFDVYDLGISTTGRFDRCRIIVVCGHREGFIFLP